MGFCADLLPYLPAGNRIFEGDGISNVRTTLVALIQLILIHPRPPVWINRNALFFCFLFIDYKFFFILPFIHRPKWSLDTDVLWVKVDFDGGGFGLVDDLKIEEWLVTPKIGYRAFEGDWGHVDLQAGLRYTWVDVEIDGAGPHVGVYDVNKSGDLWDFLGGFTGQYNINEKWYLPFMVEAGAGDSEFVWAFFAGVGYHFEKVDVNLVYKHLYYDFSDSAPMQDETTYGPMLSVKYTY